MGITHSDEAIQRSSTTEDGLRLVVDSAPALIHTSLPDGYLDFFNETWLNYLGLSLEDVAGWKWTAVIHPEDVAAIVEKWRAALATGEPFEHEARVRRADGQYRWMFHHKVPLRDERGNEQLLVSVNDTGVGSPRNRLTKSSTRSLPSNLTASVWDYPSAARSLSRMAADCGLPATRCAAQASLSPHPPKWRQMNDVQAHLVILRL